MSPEISPMQSAHHTPGHSSQSSQDASGASYNLILDHVLTNTGSYEIPLRTMYTLNSTPRSQISRPATPTGNRPPVSPMQSTFPQEAQQASADLQSSLLTQISKQRSQPCSLPPAFITTFLRRCFPTDLELVDFPQALTALDYLKDLERRRRREVAAALKRLGVSRDSIELDPHTLQQDHPGVAEWVKANEKREHKVEQRYTQLYISLRRWILVNELSLRPFSKYNCLAMLNTLYPPVLSDAFHTPSQQPTAMLTPEVLTKQRKGFLDWIARVERDGTSSLTPLMDVGKQPDDATGWPSVRQTLDEYLRLANHVIEDCTAVQCPDDLNDQGQRRPSAGWSDSTTSRSSRKADSGVSFASKGDTPNTSISSSKRPSTSGSEGKENQRPKTPSYDYERTKTGGTALEKLAREFRKFRAAPPSPTQESEPPSRRPSEFDNRHSRNDSNTSSHNSRGRERDQDRGTRSRSKSNVLARSFSRIRVRSRSRPKTAQGSRPDDAVPPTPSLPQEAMSIFEDDNDDDERGARGRMRRSMSLSRARSSSRNAAAAVRKMKSFGDGKRGRQRDGEGEEFDAEEMKRQRLAWEMKEGASRIGQAM